MERAVLEHPLILWLIDTNLEPAHEYGTKMGPRNHNVTLVKSQQYVIDPADLCRALDDGVEHRLHVRRRAADDAQHLGRYRLMLQSFTQFCVALLEFLEQPYVFNRDHGLIGEGFKQLSLLIREWTNLSSKDQNRPNRNFLS